MDISKERICCQKQSLPPNPYISKRLLADDRLTYPEDLETYSSVGNPISPRNKHATRVVMSGGGGQYPDNPPLKISEPGKAQLVRETDREQHCDPVENIANPFFTQGTPSRCYTCY